MVDDHVTHRANIGPFSSADVSRRVADLFRERVPHGCAHLVGLSISGAVTLRLLRDAPQVIDHVMVSETATRINAGLTTFMRVNEPYMRDLRPEQQALLMLRQFHVLPQYRDLVHEGVGTCKPETNAHCSKELKEIEMPQEVLAPVLVVVG